jgi:signal transduction histidine kinase
MYLLSPLYTVAQGFPPVARRITALGLLLVAGWFDYLTGQEVAAAPFYIPILLTLALFESWRICLIYAGIATAIYLGADLLNEPDALTLIYPYWRACARLIGFGLISVTTSVLVEERRRLQRSEQALAEKMAELESKNRALRDTLQEVQRLHLELTVKGNQAAAVQAVNAATYNMERPLVSLTVYVEEVARLIRRLSPTEETVLILDQLQPIVEKLQERLREMEAALQDIRTLQRKNGGKPGEELEAIPKG